jgi:hypothetical protein
MEDIQRQYDDTMHQLFVEEELKSPRNEGIICRLKMLEIEQVNMLSDMAAGSPIIAAMKAKLEKAQLK